MKHNQKIGIPSCLNPTGNDLTSSILVQKKEGREIAYHVTGEKAIYHSGHLLLKKLDKTLEKMNALDINTGKIETGGDHEKDYVNDAVLRKKGNRTDTNLYYETYSITETSEHSMRTQILTRLVVPSES